MGENEDLEQERELGAEIASTECHGCGKELAAVESDIPGVYESEPCSKCAKEPTKTAVKQETAGFLEVAGQREVGSSVVDLPPSE
jgi:hypothetical protein